MKDLNKIEERLLQKKQSEFTLKFNNALNNFRREIQNVLPVTRNKKARSEIMEWLIMRSILKKLFSSNNLIKIEVNELDKTNLPSGLNDALLDEAIAEFLDQYKEK